MDIVYPHAKGIQIGIESFWSLQWPYREQGIISININGQVGQRRKRHVSFMFFSGKDGTDISIRDGCCWFSIGFSCHGTQRSNSKWAQSTLASWMHSFPVFPWGLHVLCLGNACWVFALLSKFVVSSSTQQTQLYLTPPSIKLPTILFKKKKKVLGGFKRIDAFELWCWRRLLRVPWRLSNQ